MRMLLLLKHFLAGFRRQTLNPLMLPTIFSRLVLTGCCLALLSGCVSRTSRSTRANNLLQPHLLYSYLREHGPENDPDHVFQWNKGVLRISGQHYGYLATHQNYSNYVLVTEYKYGEKTWPPRENKARDGGVLVNFVGRDFIWPKSLEAQIIEGGTGDILVVSGATLTVDGVTKGPRTERFDRPGRNPWQDVKGFRGPNEIEKPHGQWNRMEVLCAGDRFGIKVNGIKTLEGTNASPTSGKILVQSEGAELFFRKLELHPVSHYNW